jgi:hypothetical protein
MREWRQRRGGSVEMGFERRDYLAVSRRRKMGSRLSLGSTRAQIVR